MLIANYHRGGAELVENHTLPGWPFGTAVEVMSAELLRRLDRTDHDPASRE